MASRLPSSATPPRPLQSNDPWANAITAYLTGLLSQILSHITHQQPWEHAFYQVADLPDATEWEGATIYVTDETGGATLAYSNGTDWLRVYDNAVVS